MPVQPSRGRRATRCEAGEGAGAEARLVPSSSNTSERVCGAPVGHRALGGQKTQWSGCGHNAQHGSSGTHLDRVAERSTRSMQAQYADCLRLNLRVHERGANTTLLRWPVRCCQRAAAAVLPDGGTRTEHARARCTVAARAGCQRDRNYRLSANVSITRCVQHLAAPVWGEHASAGKYLRRERQ